MLNDNRKIDYRKFFSLSLLVCSQSVIEFQYERHGQQQWSGANGSFTVTASYQRKCSQGLVQENACTQCICGCQTPHTAGYPPDGIINTSVLWSKLCRLPSSLKWPIICPMGR